MREKLNDKLKKLRNKLGLSQEYVSEILGVSRTAITAIESNNREIKAKELKIFSELYGVSMDELMYGKDEDKEIKVFARTFSELSEIDKREILNLVSFKNKVKKESQLNV